MLVLNNIHKSFGDQQVLNGLSMQVEAGQIHTLIGGNGSGKTTLLNIITGFLKAEKGEIVYQQKRLNHASPVAINNLGITRTFQDLRLITELTVKENILLAFKNNPGEQVLNSLLPQKLFNGKYKEFSLRADEILERIHLSGVKDHLGGEISYGQQKLLTLGCCLANDADLLLLDEPVAGIDTENFEKIVNLIKKLKEQGKTILQIEHRHDYVEMLSDGIWFLKEGHTKFFERYEKYKYATDCIDKQKKNQ